MKKILVLGAGEMQVPIIKKVKEKGYLAIVADYDPKAPGFKYADEKLIISTNDEDAIFKAAKEKNINGILSTSDYPVRVVAKVSSKLNLPSMSEKVATICTDKYLQRHFFNTNEIKSPAFYLINTDSDLEQINSFPCVIKPVDSSASRGVKKINSKEELYQQFFETVRFSKSGGVIVEDFIVGQEFSVETFTQNKITTIITVTEKIIQGEKDGYFVESAHIVPARIDTFQRKLIEDEVKRAINVLQVDNAPTHTEVKLNNDGAFIIEMACRLGGDYITSDLVPLATGIDMLGNLVDVTLGNEIDVQPKHTKVAVVSFLGPENYDQSIKLIDTKINQIKSSEVKAFHNGKIKNSMDRMGHIILQTDTFDELNSILGQLS